MNKLQTIAWVHWGCSFDPDQCPDPECGVCSALLCPHDNVMHFHHDGCPSCDEDEATLSFSDLESADSA
jgi:hypothetical protein